MHTGTYTEVQSFCICTTNFENGIIPVLLCQCPCLFKVVGFALKYFHYESIFHELSDPLYHDVS